MLRMSEEGIAGNYVNPHGFVHDMITLRQARGFLLDVALACSDLMLLPLLLIRWTAIRTLLASLLDA